MGQPKPFSTPRGAELAAALADRLHQSRLLYAEILDIVAEMAALGVAAEIGYPSLPAYLVDATNVSRPKANRMVAHAAAVVETGTPTGHVRPACPPCATRCATA